LLENASDCDGGCVGCVSRGDGGVGGDGASDARVSGVLADQSPGRQRARGQQSGGRVGGVGCDYAVEESRNGRRPGQSVEDEKLKC